jgi:5-methyltetrahydrofolate--homocysteine methyltransferase
LEAIAAMRRAEPGITLIAKPNAGMPRVESLGQVIYDVTPEIMAEYGLKFAAQHVKILGGCCGSTPAHLKALKAVVQNYQPPPLAEILALGQAQSGNGDRAPSDPDQRERRQSRRRARV